MRYTTNKHQRRGLLIVFEGLDGAGKSTQVDSLAQALTKKGHSVVVTRWNSSKYISKAIKRAKKAHLLTPNCFSALHAADFFNRMENIIIPSMNAGKIVIADRYSFTALARDQARGMDDECVERIYSLAIEPDIAFYCKIPVEIALTRTMEKKSGIPKYYESGMDVSGEADPVKSFREFQGRVEREYQSMADRGVLAPIDMNRDVEAIFADILRDVESLIDTSPEAVKPDTPLSIQHSPHLLNAEPSYIEECVDTEFISELPAHNLPGKLIVFEGAHCAGVTHQINALYDLLQVHKIDVVKFGIGQTWITTEIMDRAAPKNAFSPRTNVMLTASEIAYIIETQVIPALERGAVVLLNRYFITTLVCGLIRGITYDWLVRTLKSFAIRPDLTIYIDSSLETLLGRMDLSSILALESINSGIDIGFTRDIETSIDYYQRNALSLFRRIALANGIETFMSSDAQSELYGPISERAFKALGSSPDSLPVDRALKEVIQLYHAHNGYFEHAQKVRHFAVKLFDSTADIHGLNGNARRLLEFSALLHDIGRSVSAEGHEKHSYRLIMEHTFECLTKREKRIVAIISLYHNGEMNQLDNTCQWNLHAEEQLAVRKLAAILRVADALDSSDRQVIMNLRLSRERGALILDLNSANKAKAERKSLLNKKDLFEHEFGLTLLVDINREERMKTECNKTRDRLFL